MRFPSVGFAFVTVVLCSLFCGAFYDTCLQADEPVSSPVSEPVDSGEKTGVETTVETVKKNSQKAADAITETTDKIAEQVDQSEEAKKYSAGILEPIYSMAEYMNFSWFHWLAFTVMVSGVISFALQLVLAKLAVLIRGGFSIKQILVDVQGLLISLVGLFLTTQAATENSAFTSSPASVLSATVVGAVAGFLFYLWGQSQELEALSGRKHEARKESKR